MKRNQYFINNLAISVQQKFVTFDSLLKLTLEQFPSRESKQDLANCSNTFFKDKIDNIYKNIPSSKHELIASVGCNSNDFKLLTSESVTECLFFLSI